MTLTADQHDNPAVLELVMSVTDNEQIADLWTGDGGLHFPGAKG
ncbi:MAG: hypothetical protein ABSC06_38055 [Rhodopila sp.]